MPLVNLKSKLSKVGRQPDGSIACPKCGGRQFEPCRTGAQKFDAVLFLPALLGQKKKGVRCAVCGAQFTRG